MKLRVVNLALGVARYQIHSHPRGLSAYNGDSFSAHQISKILATSNLQQDYMLSNRNVQTVDLNVHVVIGETVLSSVSWMVGSTLTPMDLYDSCIVVIKCPISEKDPHGFIAIPAVRVISQIGPWIGSPNGKDYEPGEPIFIPRGAGVGGPDSKVRQWIYWIPCGSGKWLHVRIPNTSVLGKCTVEVVNDMQVTKMLSVGNLNISLKEVDDVKEVLDISRKATNHLLSLLN